MRRKIGGVLSLLCAAAILAGGYAAIGLFDRLITPQASVTQVPKDGDATTVLRFDKGTAFQLYPFDELEEQSCVDVCESAAFDLAYHETCEWEGYEDMTMEPFREIVNQVLYDNLTARMVLEDIVPTNLTPDVLGATRYQASNDICYIQDFPLTFVQEERVVVRLLTAAFHTDFLDEFQLLFLSLAPPAGTASEEVDLERVAGMLNEQFDTFQELYRSAMEIHESVVSEGVYDAEWEKNVFTPVMDVMDTHKTWSESIDMLDITSHECVLYDDEVLFVMQSSAGRLVLLYSPALGAFYGGSLCMTA